MSELIVGIMLFYKNMGGVNERLVIKFVNKIYISFPSEKTIIL